METVRINTRRITFTEDEINTLRKAQRILNDFDTECNEGTYADDAAEMLDQFLNDDLKGGTTYTEVI